MCAPVSQYFSQCLRSRLELPYQALFQPSHNSYSGFTTSRLGGLSSLFLCMQQRVNSNNKKLERKLLQHEGSFSDQ